VRLLLTAPSVVLVDALVGKIVAESVAGSFCILPRHADIATVLVPGLLTYVPADPGHDGTADTASTRQTDRQDGEVVVAIDHGVLVKCADEVRVTCQRAMVAGDLADAVATVQQRFQRESEREKRARTMLLRLEADILRRLGELRD
jgi:F-type H+-transporting ATPase subunit epsilon